MKCDSYSDFKILSLANYGEIWFGDFHHEVYITTNKRRLNQIKKINCRWSQYYMINLYNIK